MKIDHIAIWTQDLEGLRSFYIDHFGGQSGPRYVNDKKGFQSYFLSFQNGTRLELMSRQDVTQEKDANPYIGFAHLAFSVPLRKDVDSVAIRFRKMGLPIIDGPRFTGDGYYEFVTQDPDGNIIEITALEPI